MTLRLLPYGPDALLVELPDPAGVVAFREAALLLPGVIEAVAGAVTVLVEVDLGLASLAAVRAGLESIPAQANEVSGTGHVDLSVVYDGADLADVASLTGLTPAAVVARHSAPLYTVRFCGFAPGFAYLDGLDPALHVARRATPRTDVPAGSVAVAGEFTGVYPRRSPGGWQLLGRTDAELWNSAASPPALLRPGTTVRFVPS
jgi:KipI family sensor histidine kinase inhibitor